MSSLPIFSQPSRREFSLLAGASLLGLLLPRQGWAHTHQAHDPHAHVMPVETFLAGVQASEVAKVRQLTAEEAGIITAAAARIVPTDHDPGATEAGAIYYIDNQLELSSKRRDLYKAGAAQLTRVATELHRAKFVDLKPEQQDAILRAAQGKQHASWPQSGEFFSALRQDAIDAFYGFGIGWKVVGYSGPAQPVGHMEFGHGICTPNQ